MERATHKHHSDVAMRETPELLERFGERVRQLRQAQGYSQEGFAAACGLDRTYVGGIERAERNPTFKILSQIADTLGVSLSELFADL